MDYVKVFTLRTERKLWSNNRIGGNDNEENISKTNREIDSSAL